MFSAWLRGIARNKVSEHFRAAISRYQEAPIGPLPPGGGCVSRSRCWGRVEWRFESSETIEVLMHCITRLPDRMRRVVHAGLNGNRPADLAAELNTSVGAVYSLALSCEPACSANV